MSKSSSLQLSQDPTLGYQHLYILPVALLNNPAFSPEVIQKYDILSIVFEVAEQRPGAPRLGNVCEVLAKSTTASLNRPLKVGGDTFSKMDRKGLEDEGTPLAIAVLTS